MGTEEARANQICKQTLQHLQRWQQEEAVHGYCPHWLSSLHFPGEEQRYGSGVWHSPWVVQFKNFPFNFVLIFRKGMTVVILKYLGILIQFQGSSLGDFLSFLGGAGI